MLTVYGIETSYTNFIINLLYRIVATVLTVYGIETQRWSLADLHIWYWLQQCLPFTVCAEGCETAEEQCDDEVCTSQVPERSEGKTRVIRDSDYRLRY